MRSESPRHRVEPRPLRPTIDATQKERIVFQFLRDAPHLLNSHRLGMATSTVQPWPHQIKVSDAVIERFPHSFMLCDEVGLGKTVEAGLAIRQLLLSGRVKRALILVPKSVLVQWQEELYEKFVLNIPRYDGHTFYDVFGRALKVPTGTQPVGRPSRVPGVQPPGEAAGTPGPVGRGAGLATGRGR